MAREAEMQRLMKTFETRADPATLPPAKDSVKKCKVMNKLSWRTWDRTSRNSGALGRLVLVWAYAQIMTSAAGKYCGAAPEK